MRKTNSFGFCILLAVMARTTVSYSTLYVHSTFRGPNGRALVPDGLEYDMDGTSHVRFAIPQESDLMQFITTAAAAATDSAADGLKESIVRAYNRWASAKDLPFKTANDIVSVQADGEHHFQVEWKKDNRIFEQVILGDSAEELLRQDKAASAAGAASKGATSPAQVWVNGNLVGVLDGPESLSEILPKIPASANKFCYKRYPECIHLDRYYTSYLRYSHAFDHIFDNLVALEDPKILGEDADTDEGITLIGTATLNDWIMGGKLTSRLWVRDQGDSILFLRPLYQDDMETVDRKYEVRDPVKLELIRKELRRLCYVAKLRHPYVTELLSKRVDSRKEAKQASKESVRDSKRLQYYGF